MGMIKKREKRKEKKEKIEKKKEKITKDNRIVIKIIMITLTASGSLHPPDCIVFDLIFVDFQIIFLLIEFVDNS